MRVLLDANVYISYLLAPEGEGVIVHIVEVGIAGAFRMLLPKALLEKIVVTVLKHEHLSRRIPPDDLRTFVNLISREAEVIPKIGASIPSVTRDRKDDYLVAYALVGQADYLVSGNKYLLALERIGEMEIVTPAAFLRLLE